MRYALLAWVLVASPGLAQEKKTPDRVGRIIIEGNTDTPDRVILRRIAFWPARYSNIPRSEQQKCD